MALSHDTSRCAGTRCHTRTTCQRFTDTNVGPDTYVMHAIAPSENCAFRIAQPKGQGVKDMSKGAVGHGTDVVFFA